MILREYDSRTELEKELSSRIFNILRSAISQKGSASLLFSGGSTPKALMNLLAESYFDWSPVNVGLADDRMVDESSEFSNASMLKHEFINRIPEAKRPVFCPLVFDVTDKDINHKKSMESVHQLGDIDILLLGMGTDGHFASLFPEDESSAKGLKDSCKDALIYTRAPAFPNDRISFSWSFLKKSAHLFLHITGTEKKNIIFDIEKRQILPVDTILKSKDINPEIYWAA